jgi:hypothetical protein
VIAPRCDAKKFYKQNGGRRKTLEPPLILLFLFSVWAIEIKLQECQENGKFL